MDLACAKIDNAGAAANEEKMVWIVNWVSDRVQTLLELTTRQLKTRREASNKVTAIGVNMLTDDNEGNEVLKQKCDKMQNEVLNVGVQMMTKEWTIIISVQRYMVT